MKSCRIIMITLILFQLLLPGLCQAEDETADTNATVELSPEGTIEEPASIEIPASITLEKSRFSPGEKMTVQFTAPHTYSQDAWIGIVPSDVPHGSEAVNDEYDTSLQYLYGHTSGLLTYNAPSQPGSYDLRMHDTDGGGNEVASATFIVERDIRKGAHTAGVRTIKPAYSESEPITVEFTNLPGNAQDLITIVKTGTPDSTLDQWFYTGGAENGSLEFGGLGSGSYEVRLYFDWPNGGYNVITRHPFSVTK